jgi:hypothetical protein
LALDICASDWGTQMTNLGDSTRQDTVLSLTSNEVDPSTLVVTAGGLTLTATDYLYDPTANTVTLVTPADPNVTVTATYDLLATCPLP